MGEPEEVWKDRIGNTLSLSSPSRFDGKPVSSYQIYALLLAFQQRDNKVRNRDFPKIWD